MNTNPTDGLGDTISRKAMPVIEQAADQADALIQSGLDTVRETSQQVRERAKQANEMTVAYIRREPLKSVLIAAATGAALVAFCNMLPRARAR